MIIGKMWRAFKAQLNKIANFFWTADPIAQMQYEYDQAIEQIRGGKDGLAQYRALVERVASQVGQNKTTVNRLEARVKAYLKAGDRETAAKYALELKKAKEEMAENVSQLDMHEKAYENNVAKIRHATKKVGEIQEKIKKYDAELKMSRAEAELAEVVGSTNFDITTDLGQIEGVLQDEINKNRAKARVAADLSSDGVDTIQEELAADSVLADSALHEFEVEMGLVTAQTANIQDEQKNLGPAQTETN